MKKFILSLCFAFISLLASAQIADSLFKSEDYIKAIDSYSAIVKAEPENLQANRRLAFCYMNVVNFKHLAFYYFERALIIDPNDMASNYYYGLLEKEAFLNNDLTVKQKANLKVSATKHLSLAAKLGSEEAKEELKGL